jgi:hypothetical protein
MKSSTIRHAVRAAVVSAAVGVGALAMAGSALAAPTYNSADLSITGGRATALTGCLNVAKTAARHHRQIQLNTCDNFAVATGGAVKLTDVAIFIDQNGHRRFGSNSASVNIQGGDATAVASCLNVLHGRATVDQENQCSNTAVATGGDVTLTDVTVVVTQS